MPIRQKNDVEKQRPQLAPLELPVRVDDGLAGDSVGKDEHNQQKDEGDYLRYLEVTLRNYDMFCHKLHSGIRYHSVKDDQFWS